MLNWLTGKQVSALQRCWKWEQGIQSQWSNGWRSLMAEQQPKTRKDKREGGGRAPSSEPFPAPLPPGFTFLSLQQGSRQTASRRSKLTPRCCHGESEQARASEKEREARRREPVWLQLDLRVIWRTRPGRAETSPFSVYTREPKSSPLLSLLSLPTASALQQLNQ